MPFSSPAQASKTVVSLTRLELATLNSLRTYGDRVQARVADATPILEPWANTTAWTGTGTVASNRVYSAGGLTRAAPTSPRWIVRTTLHATGAAGKFAYFGVGSSGAAGDLVGIGQGSASTTAAILRGANISASAVVIPKALPVLAAGDYLCTVVVGETHVSLTLQSVPTGQNIWGARLARSAFPGPINTIFLSANDTTAGGLTWGPMVIYPELAVPPLASRVVGGFTLFGPTRPLMHMRTDNSNGHVISIPGDNDSRYPAPVVAFLHQASTGVAMTPWTESRLAGITAALEAAGYIIVASDNGPGITGGGTQDKFANQASQDDYAALIRWTRERFNTGALMLLGPSQGGLVAQNLLGGKTVGGIAAVATISSGSDIVAMEPLPTYQTALRAAYGASSAAQFAANAAAFNPAARQPAEYRGVPQRFYIGTSDAVVDQNVQVYPFAAKLAQYAPEASIVSLPVGHLDNALYQATDLLNFFEKYR